MKAIKIQATQTTANYRKTEQAKLRNSFPLPPISTFFLGGGDIHNAVGWEEYHPTHIGIKKGGMGVFQREHTQTNGFRTMYNMIERALFNLLL